MPSAAQGQKVKSQWDGADKDAFTLNLYNDMFAAHSGFRGMFKNHTGDPSYSNAAWKKQLNVTRDALSDAFDLAGKGDFDGLNGYLNKLARKHDKHGVGAAQFQALKPTAVATAKRSIPGCDAGAWEAILIHVLDHIA